MNNYLKAKKYRRVIYMYYKISLKMVTMDDISSLLIHF